jgi:hypothetical protein
VALRCDALEAATWWFRRMGSCEVSIMRQKPSHKRTRGKSGDVGLMRQKNPAAVALGRIGGVKGGKSRMAQLSPTQRSELGRKAAAVRWSKKKK